MASIKVLFLLAAIVACFSATNANAWGRSGKITEEDEVSVNGELIHEKRELDTDCRHVKTTATLPDGTTSTSDEDFERGVEVIQVSDDEGVCFVRLISNEEKEEAATCVRGVVLRDGNKPDTEEQTYEEGPEVPASLLSPEQQAQCEGTRIVLALPEGAHGREKRQTGCKIRITVHRVYRCTKTTPRVCTYLGSIYRIQRICPTTPATSA